MQKKTGFLPYDWFKLFIAILLGLALFLFSRNQPQNPPPPPPPAVEEEAPVPQPTPTKAAEETETTAEEESGTPAKVSLPPFPEASAALEYDTAKGGLIAADGTLVYTLNADGNGWTPLIPDELNDLKLAGEWQLLDADGNPAYEWDAASQSWVAVPQAEISAEAESEPTAETPAATTNIVDCPGAAEPRLTGGQQANIMRDVNFRSSPGVADNWIGGFTTGEQVKVIGETACTPYGNGAYLWWQVERADGKVGWIAEAMANSPSYFLAPVE